MALALATGIGHLALSIVNLIPGEPTVGPVFAAMGAVYVAAATLIFLRVQVIYVLTVFYSVGLLAAYFLTRDSLPIEPIGLAIKAVEVALVVALLGLVRVTTRIRSGQRPQEPAVSR